jgi:hypothetical protein
MEGLEMVKTVDGVELHRCPKKPKLVIYCGEKNCTLDCDIYAKQSGYLADCIDMVDRD